MSKKAAVGPIQSTAGAVPVRNEKGQVSMQKVKVHRYISGKRPDYAPRSSSEEESEDEEFVVPLRLKQDDEDEVDDRDDDAEAEYSTSEQMDPRLRRLQISNEARMRRVEKPQVLDDDEEEDEEEESEEERPGRRHDSDSDSGDEILDDAEIEKRRAYIRQRALEKQEDELLVKEDEKESGSEESESEYEEYTDSEEEARPRLKPVFVFKQDRVTLKEKEQLDQKEKYVEENSRQRHQERRKETLKIVEEEIQREKNMVKSGNDGTVAESQKLEDVNTDDENEEAEYEAWKIRELKRIKRDREEREAIEREKMEIERLHGLTEEERRLEMKMKPKQIINKAAKGKYKFLQKYYHRGVFYLDKEEDVFKRDYSAPTLEDHFDKTILPKVMQVKNFGRSGRTKYTHLVDQDTTNFESPWVSETTQNLKFYATQAAGVRQQFEKPSTKKRKMDAE